MQPRHLLALLFCCTLLPVLARAAVTPAPLFDAISGMQPVRLRTLDARVDLGAGQAQTTLRMEVFNPNDRPLEATLRLPLLANQQLIGFALDIDGKLRTAVPVAKAHGREVFEAVERRRVDPALLERSAGNNFKLRIFPVPAHGIRQVEVTYSEAVSMHGREAHYRLPLQYAGRLARFSAHFAVHSADGPPRLADDAAPWKPTAAGYEKDYQLLEGTPPRALDVSYATQGAPTVTIQQFDGERFFLADLPLPDAVRATVPAPRVLGLLWDASGSHTPDQVTHELDALAPWFRALGDVDVRLVLLRDRAAPTQAFRVAHGDWRALRYALEHVDYDGASALASFTPPQADAYLLVSDGLLNYGPAQFPALRAPLDVLTAAPGADHDRLGALAERTGGQMIDIAGGDGARVAPLLLHPRAHVASLRTNGVRDVVFDPAGVQDGRLRVAGKVDARHGSLAVTLAGYATPVTIAIEVGADSPPGDQAGRTWARYRLHALGADYELHQAEIERIGRRFALPTRATSLIVLESAADYLNYDIAPPPELQSAFDQLRRARTATMDTSRASHLELVVQEFAQKRAWWDRRYPKTAPPPSTPTRKNDERAPAMAEQAPVATVAASGQLPPYVLRETASAPSLPPPPPPEMAEPAPPLQAAVVAPAQAPPVMAAPLETRMAGAAPARVAMERSREPAAQAEGPAVKPSSGGHAVIALQPWEPDAPYARRLREAAPGRVYALYLDEKPTYANSTAFFIDVATILAHKGQRMLALRVLSNLAEMDLDNREVLRILGSRLRQAGEPGLAVPILEQVRALAPDEPQSFRDLGLAYDAVGRHDDAIDQLYEVVLRPWPGRFAEIELIALAELNAIVAAHPGLDVHRIDSRLLHNLPLDLRVVLDWDARDTDVDLIVTDPNGERCFYGHRLTRQGGSLSRDFTSGYGPEEFSLREAKPGVYKIEANYFGQHQQVVAGATTLQLTLTTGFGTRAAATRTTTVRLRDQGDNVLVGSFEVGRPSRDSR